MQLWPTFLKARQRMIQVVAHSRGAVSAAGFLKYEKGRGARIVAQVSVVPMTAQNAFAFRAFLHSLRGKGAFLFPFARGVTAAAATSVYSDATQFSDGATYIDATATTLASAAAEAAETLTVVGAYTGFSVGGFVKVADQILRVVSAADAGGGNTTLGIRPALRSAAASGTTVELDNLYGEMRLVSTPQVPIQRGRYSPSIDVELEENY